MSIPKIIHQLWRDTAVPERYLPLVESWKRYHPAWEYRLWTDETMRAFVAERYPAFLPVYDGYDVAICRPDAFRYLVLHAIGGLYADLDLQCLKPIESLIDGKSFVVAVEPAAHLANPEVKFRQLDKLVCPTFLASAEGHPFLEYLHRQMEQTRRFPGPLDRTGPFMLTRAYERFPGRSSLTLLPAETVYPLSNSECWSGKAFDIEHFERATRRAYAVHHWDGTWFRKPSSELPALPNEFSVSVIGEAGARRPATTDGFVSCLMVTRDRYPFARLAIESFRRQTHPERELLIVQDGTDTRLIDEFGQAGDPMIRVLRPPTQGLSLGALRNFSIAEARGPHICQWDDDDLYDPDRIRLQMLALKGAEADACFLSRWLLWMPLSQRLGISSHALEGSILALKSALPTYPDASHAEDTTLLNDLRARSRIAVLDMPRLYAYAFHGRNAWDADHFETRWNRCQTRYTGERYGAVLEELGKRLPISVYESLLTDVVPAMPATPRSADTVLAAATTEPAAADRIGVNFYGYTASNAGIAVAARATVAALAAARLPHAVFDLDSTTGPFPLPSPHAINIFQATPDRILHSGKPNPRIVPANFAGRYNIAYLVWESTTSFPKEWRPALPHFDEIWVPSRFVADCFKPVTSLPIIEIPHALPDRPVVLQRTDFAIPQDRFVFFFMFDGLSGLPRKNPLGLIEAFKRAFPPGDRRAALFIKARTLSKKDLALLQAAAAGSPIVVFIEDLVRKALSSLVAHCDAYVSLHRSEGFGLTIAEAMQFKRPVIATGYSGNLDFMTPENSYPVPYRLVRLDQPEGPFPAGTEWAEPDLDAAAEMMRAVVADPAEARRRGERAAADIAAKFNPLAIGARIEQRFAELRESGRLDSKTESNPPAPTGGAAMPIKQPVRSAAVQSRPSPPPAVLVLTPVRDAASYLPRYFELLDRLDFDRSRLSLGLLEGDSTDGTYDQLVRRLPALKPRYCTVTLLKHDFGNRIVGPRWRREAQRERRGVLARARNRLLAEALRDEAWVLWLDVDLVDYPASLINDLLAAGKEIVVPHCVLPSGKTFDLNSFRFAPEKGPVEDAAHLFDGIYQPPFGHGRRYLDELPGDGPVPIDAVGGTALLIRADLHRDGLVFPAYSHRGYIETEGLAMMAKDMGHQSWALPKLRIVHADR